MTKILFICHGNICRSLMAEFVMKDLVKKARLEKDFQIASATTGTEEIGNPVYSPARRKLAEHGIQCDGHSARQLTNRDYDLLIDMDVRNLQNMHRICGGDFAGKMHLLWTLPTAKRGPQQSQMLCWEDEKQGSGWSFRRMRKRRKADFASTK